VHFYGNLPTKKHYFSAKNSDARYRFTAMATLSAPKKFGNHGHASIICLLRQRFSITVRALCGGMFSALTTQIFAACAGDFELIDALFAHEPQPISIDPP
jgi:hypothetical protein